MCTLLTRYCVILNALLSHTQTKYVRYVSLHACLFECFYVACSVFCLGFNSLIFEINK